MCDKSSAPSRWFDIFLLDFAYSFIFFFVILFVLDLEYMLVMSQEFVRSNGLELGALNKIEGMRDCSCKGEVPKL